MVALSSPSEADKGRPAKVRSARAVPTASIRPAGRSFVISIAASIVFLAAWQLVCQLQLVPPLFLPSPIAVIDQFIAVSRDGFSDATLFQHAATSLMRVSVAFLIAAMTAVPLGLAMGLNRWFKGIFDPLIELYWPIPPLAYLPLVIIWLGIGEVAKISIIALAMFAPLVISAQAGVRSVSLGSIQAALSLGASRRQLFLHVYLPGALPEILTGVRIAIGAGWSTLVAAELVAATRGLGFMTLSASEFLVTDVVFVGIFTIAIFAIGFTLAVRTLERVLTPWKGQD
jgi:taurine transport system permease protein